MKFGMEKISRFGIKYLRLPIRRIKYLMVAHTSVGRGVIMSFGISVSMSG